MLMVADVGEGGVKNRLKSADVLYGRPLMGLIHHLILVCKLKNLVIDG